MAPTPTPTNTLDIGLATATALPLSSSNSTAEVLRLKTLEILLELAKVEAANEKDRRGSFVDVVSGIIVFGVIGFLMYYMMKMERAHMISKNAMFASPIHEGQT